MRRNAWKPGPAAASGSVLVSATRFRYRRWRDMPAVWRHGWRLRHAWSSREGAVGLFTAVELTRPVTWSLSAWTGEEDLRRFMRDPGHVALMRAFRPRLAESTSVTWRAAAFDPEPAWREAVARLGAARAEETGTD